MTNKNKNENSVIESPSTGNGTLTDDLKKRIIKKLPAGVDISSIGNIDLHEAEQIAYEEIVFLTEDDLIEGLEDFELIPLKNDSMIDEKNVEINKKSSLLRIKDISETENSEKIVPEIENEVLFENFNNNDSEVIPDIIEDSAEKDESESAEEVKAEGIIKEDLVPLKSDETASDDVKTVEQKSSSEIETGVLDDDSIPGSIEDFSDGTVDKSENFKADPSEKPTAIITENSINIQFDEIFIEGSGEKEIIPSRFSDQRGVNKPKFIDDLQVHGSGKDEIKDYQGDPLTERLSRIIHVSDSPMSVITARSDYYDDHTYILEDTTFYDKTAVYAGDKDEIFYSDPELDFLENAIVKNDFSRFIQEIDDYYDISKNESESRISEILGLNSEEREIIDKELFAAYYSNIDFESEIDFLNPDLDFINRSYVKNKDVSYILDNMDSFFEEEKISIEDDITSGSAIVFEEDVEDLKFLMERDYGYKAREKVESEIIPEVSVEEPLADMEITFGPEADDSNQDTLDIIDITDQVIILEDHDNVEVFTSQFPEKKDDLVKLLSYLDGLFEKLPEEAVKKFAQSEYFDLYVKVMNEIGA